MEWCLNLAERVLHKSLFHDLRQETVFLAFMMMPILVVQVMMLGFALPEMHDGHRHLVMMMVRYSCVSQQNYVGHQQHHYG